MTFYISKEYVYEQVKMKAAYAGAKCGDCRRLLLTDADGAMLEGMWTEAVTQISGFVPGIAINDAGSEAEVECRLPASDNGSAHEGRLREHLQRFLISHMAWAWLRLCGTEADDDAWSAEQGLLQRMLAPKRR